MSIAAWASAMLTVLALIALLAHKPLGMSEWNNFVSSVTLVGLFWAFAWFLAWATGGLS